MANNPTQFVAHGQTLPCSSCKTALNFLNNSDVKREKGKITLYCPNCSLKHFGEIEPLKAWCLKMKQEDRARKREGKSNGQEEKSGAA